MVVLFSLSPVSLFVDKWKTEHQEDRNNALVEIYEGKVKMGNVDSYKYLGQYISNQNNNMANINAVKISSHSISNKIFNILSSLKLGRHYFECGLILMNRMLRSTIKYTAETYYNLSELEIRHLKKI